MCTNSQIVVPQITPTSTADETATNTNISTVCKSVCYYFSRLQLVDCCE